MLLAELLLSTEGWERRGRRAESLMTANVDRRGKVGTHEGSGDIQQEDISQQSDEVE